MHTFCSIQVSSFNADIVYSKQIFIFNNPGPSAAKPHDLLSILAGSTSCQGFTREACVVAFNSLEMAKQANL